ncbi:MAG: hypothetical protein IJQ02_13070 [Oscillospiraceae bacterium]|nr:hypothetical protein [Oscillospiraceae bacterium]
MPPRGHSSSSHSSSSRSSSSRSSSSRSSSSHSSSSRSSSSGSRSSYSRGPSSHSSSSHSSRPSAFGNSYSRANQPAPPSAPKRNRVNQPSGFQIIGNRRPSYFYGRRHEYIYYPIAWTDTMTGTRYEQGYYDENGQRYDNVAFEKDGKYENVLCHCPYCGQDSILNLDAETVAARSLQCPHCSGPMEIKSQLDEAINSSTGSSYSGSSYSEAVRSSRKKRRGWLIALIIFAVLWLIGSCSESRSEQLISHEDYNAPAQQVTVLDNDYASNLELFGEVVSLVSSDGTAYTIASEGQAADRQMTWDDSFDSYYEPESECWLWYNSDVDPGIWQYWYEGISSDYGDYGWMEHESTGWYIETSDGNWIPLPSDYSTDGLWYIAG